MGQIEGSNMVWYCLGGHVRTVNTDAVRVVYFRGGQVSRDERPAETKPPPAALMRQLRVAANGGFDPLAG